MLRKVINKLCTPAFVYLVVSSISLVILMVQNANNTNTLCVGNLLCDVDNIPALFLLDFSYIIFWTFILDSVCKAGHKQISWLLVLLPYLLSIVLLGLFMMNRGVIYAY